MITNSKLQEFNSLIKKTSDYFYDNCFTIVYGIGRTLLAMGLLITFLFNTNGMLFDETLFGQGTIDNFADNINLFLLFGYENLWLAEIISIVILLVVISGFFPAVTGILHWWVAFSFTNAAALADGGDQVAAVLLLMLIPVTLLDRRKNHYLPPKEQGVLSRYVSSLMLKFIIPIQMAAIYLHAVTDKLYKVVEWRNGTAVYYFSKDNVFGSVMLENMDLLSFTFTATLFTWGTLLLELTLAGTLFMSYKNKKWALLLGVFFHFSIAVMFGLVSFMFSMVGGLVIYTINPKAFTNLKNGKSYISIIRQSSIMKVLSYSIIPIVAIISFWGFSKNIMDVFDILCLCLISTTFIVFIHSKSLIKWKKRYRVKHYSSDIGDEKRINVTS